MQVHYVDPAVEAEATENEFFRSLHALNLSPYVLVTLSSSLRVVASSSPVSKAPHY